VSERDVRAAPLARSVWRGARLWLALAALVVVGGVLVTAATSAPSVPLAPGSAAHSGSKALSVLLRARGTNVHSTTSLTDALDAPATSTVLVAFPDDLGSDQLTQLVHSGHRLVMIDPDMMSVASIASNRSISDETDTDDPVAPGCSWMGAQAAGAVRFPVATDIYTGGSGCYGGAVIITDRLVLIGSPALLRNDHLATDNVAALDINAISANGSVTDVLWLLPGADDTGSGSPSVWQLFPPWSQRAFWWLLVVGVLVALWRGRRLGPVVTEPLPVIVRSAEIVEGQGRLYRRASARDRTAALLRAATVARLASRLGLDRRATPLQVATVAGIAGNNQRELTALLDGPPPEDDTSLLDLARGLAAVEHDLQTTYSRSNIAGDTRGGHRVPRGLHE
jgi:hypothetical protein